MIFIHFLRLVPENPEAAQKASLITYSEAIEQYVEARFGKPLSLHIEHDYVEIVLEQPHSLKGLRALNRDLQNDAPLMRAFAVGDGARAGNESGPLVTAGNKFYAIASDYASEQEGLRRTGVIFEMIPVQSLDHFFSDHNTILRVADAAPQPLGEVLSSFAEEGMDSRHFRDIKSSYFGYLPYYHYLLVVEQTDIPLIEMGKWYLMSLDGERPLNQRAGRLFRVIAEESYEEYHLEGVDIPGILYPVSEEMQVQLKTMFEIAGDDGVMDDGDNPAPETIDILFGDIQQATAIDRLEVFNVGQALCVGIHSVVGGANVIQGFFDFGVPFLITTPSPGAAPDYNQIRRMIHNSGPLTIVLSHWHLDHCIMALPLQQYLGKTSWLVPQEGLGTVAQRIRNTIRAKGGRVRALKATTASTALNRNPAIHYGKINYPAVNALNHIHHHGIYSQVRLSGGETVFLAGDCTYAALPAAVRDGMGNANGYHNLQASHHGGNYHITPAAMNINDIPKAFARPQPPVLYSVGRNNQHGHPDPNAVQEHRRRGWTGYYDTLNTGYFIP